MSRYSRAISLMLLLAAFVWLARVLSGNLATVSGFAISGEAGQNASVPPGVGGATPLNLIPPIGTNAGDGLLSGIILVGVLCGYLAWRVRDALPREEGTAAGFLIFLLLSLGAFLGLLVEGRAIVALLIALGSYSAAGHGLGEALSLAFFVTGAAVIAVSFGSLVVFLARRRRRITLQPESSGDSVAKDFARAIDGTVYSLRYGSDLRMAVLRCYKALCDTLQDGGAADSPELTAREFEAMAEKKLAVDRENLRLITRLFEKARYSQDAIDEAEVREAETSLMNLQRELRARSGWPGGMGP
ncbi:MAG: DUF4129 domain-containing protein [Thaumarchaeota archaeon]|nr:DUF4129 domain-containing protein [Nitrososphaerota archaeon]